MKRYTLALFLSLASANVFQSLIAAPAHLAMNGALFLAGIASTQNLYQDYTYHPSTTRHLPSRWNNRKYGQVFITGWAFCHSVSEFYKAYQKNKKEQECITV